MALYGGIPMTCHFFGGNRKLPAIGAQTCCATLEVCLDDDWTGCFRIFCANIDWVVLNVYIYIFTTPKNVHFLGILQPKKLIALLNKESHTDCTIYVICYHLDGYNYAIEPGHAGNDTDTRTGGL